MFKDKREEKIKVVDIDIKADMDPKLQRIVQQFKEKIDYRPGLVSTNETGEEVTNVIVKLKDPNLPVEGLKIRTLVGQLATGSISLSKIEEIRNNKNVLSMKAPNTVSEMLDAAVPEIHASPPLHEQVCEGGLDGSGVIIGIVDYMCDFTHTNFLNDDETSRVLYLWDQKGGKNPKSPEGYEYGREFNKEDIEKALEKRNPIDHLKYYVEARSHGTHVMGIATGNGRATGRPGVAPKSDIIFVDSDTNDFIQEGPGALKSSFGDSIRLCEAVKYIFDKADELNRPAVVNISLGTYGGPHDGTSLVEQYFDQLLETNNRAIVISAGNSFERRIHTCGKIEPDQPTKLEWEIGFNDRSDNELEIWYKENDELEVEVITPSNQSLGRIPLGQSKSANSNGETVVLIAHRKDDPNNHDNQIDIFVSKNFGYGKWSIILHPVNINNGTYYSWIERDPARGGQSTFSFNTSKSCHTLGSISTGKLTIAVGSYDPRDPNRTISNFSSSGPTRDGREKPEVSAPGHKIWSAMARSTITRKSGTSMSAPAVTGTIALMMQAAKQKGKNIGIHEIRKIIIDNSQELPPPIGQFDFRYGNGRIDAFRSTKEIIEGNGDKKIRLEIKPAEKISFGIIHSSMMVEQDKSIKEIKVGMDISHSFIGDLVIELVCPNGTTVKLHDREGGWRNDIKNTYTIQDNPELNKFVEANARGEWVLKVADLHYLSNGILNAWSLEIIFE